MSLLAELERVGELIAKATPGEWRAHDHRNMAALGEKASEWIGYAWVGYANTDGAGFDGKVACLDRRDDASKPFRQRAATDTAAIAAAVNLLRSHGTALREAVADAERYRWLVSEWTKPLAFTHRPVLDAFGTGDRAIIDAAIDAALGLGAEGERA